MTSTELRTYARADLRSFATAAIEAVTTLERRLDAMEKFLGPLVIPGTSVADKITSAFAVLTAKLESGEPIPATRVTRQPDGTLKREKVELSTEPPYMIRWPHPDPEAKFCGYNAEADCECWRKGAGKYLLCDWTNQTYNSSQAWCSVEAVTESDCHERQAAARLAREAEERERVERQAENIAFVECDTCRKKPGTPLLCAGCLNNRETIGNLVEQIAELKRQAGTRDECQLSVESQDAPPTAVDNREELRSMILADVVKARDATIAEAVEVIRNLLKYVEGYSHFGARCDAMSFLSRHAVGDETPPAVAPEPDGAAMIAEERRQHQSREGWTPEHDATHRSNELAIAAACYAISSTPARCVKKKPPVALPQDAWPWDKSWDKRGKHGRIKQLVIAGSLLAAEIDRLLAMYKRMAEKMSSEPAASAVQPSKDSPHECEQCGARISFSRCPFCGHKQQPAASDDSPREAVPSVVPCGATREWAGITISCDKPKGHSGSHHTTIDVPAGGWVVCDSASEALWDAPPEPLAARLQAAIELVARNVKTGQSLTIHSGGKHCWCGVNYGDKRDLVAAAEAAAILAGEKQP